MLSRILNFLALIFVSSFLVTASSRFQKLSLQNRLQRNTVNANRFSTNPLRALDESIAARLLGFKPRNPPNGSLFTWDMIVQEPPDTIWNVTFANLINDYHHPENCPPNDWQYHSLIYMKQVLEFWAELSEEEEIPYVLSFGSLLGYARDKNYTPYDADMDVMLPSWAYDRLLKYATPLPMNLDRDKTKFALFLHPEFRNTALEERRRYTCNGQVVDIYEGLCSFIGNMGRLSIHGRHLDLFAMDHLPKQDILVVSKGDEVAISKPSYFIPPRPCTFYGVKLLCPNDYINAIRAWYGPTTAALRPSQLCIDGHWRTSREAPEAHTELFEQWKNQVGPIAATESYYTKDIWKHMKGRSFCNWLGSTIDPNENGICNYYVSKQKKKILITI